MRIRFAMGWVICLIISGWSALLLQGCGQVRGGGSTAAVQAVAMAVEGAPIAGQVGSFYSTTISVVGGEPAYTWAVSSGALPSGIQLAPATGVLSGVPVSAGTSTFALTATDSSRARVQATETMAITIAPRVPALTAVSQTMPPATVGASYAATLLASGGTPGYTWSVASGSLPAGLSLSASSGMLSGAPTMAGSYSFAVAVQDAASPTQRVTAAVTLEVAAATQSVNVPGHTTWYVRADGGTRYSANVPTGQCDGLGDAAYPGTGVNQHCAFNDVRLLWQDGSYAFFNSPFPAAGWVGSGGDTYVVRGSIAAGSQPFRVGWSAAEGNGADPSLVAAGNPAPYRGWRGNPYSGPPTPPAGTAAAHTRILGENWQNCHAQSARTPVLAGFSVGSAFNFSSSYVDFQCFDISDRAECATDCVAGQDFGVEGIGLSNAADHLLLQDVRVHGMKTFGMLGPSGDGSVFQYLSLVGNGGGGWNADAGDGTTGTGTLLVQNFEIKWNGCAEEFPLRDALPYTKCTDQSSGGYGDGFGTATVVSKPGWQARFDQGEVAYNTQDGLDALHLVGNGSSMTITRVLAYGNMGQQVKVGGASGTLEDSVVVGNCSAMANAIPGTAAGYNARLSDFCRAGNQPVLLTVGHASTTRVRHNTILGAGALLLGYECDGTAGFCDGSALIELRDNVLLGNRNPDRGLPGANFLMVQDDTYTNAAACNAAADKHHHWSTDGMNGCANDVFLNAGSANDHNVYFQVKDLCSDHNGQANLCLSPGLASEVVPAFGFPDVTLSAQGGAAFHAGVALPTLLSDYSGAGFDAVSPSAGALERGSMLQPYRATN